MPIYKVDGDIYNIPDDKVEAFEKRYPNSSISYANGGDKYDIPVSKKNVFTKKYPNAVYYEESGRKDSTPAVVPGSSSPVVQPRDGQPAVGVIREQSPASTKSEVPLPIWQQEETIKGFAPAFNQGWDALYQGGKSAMGETVGLLNGSQRDYSKATSLLDELVDSQYKLNEFDAEKALKDYKDRKFQREVNDWEKAMEQRRREREGMGFFDSLVHRFKDPLRPLGQYDSSARAFANLKVGDEVQLKRAYRAIQDALKESGGDIEKAYAFLGRYAAKETWGDKTAREAREALAEHKPTEGVAAWVGNLVPQMVGNVVAIAASTNPYTRWMARPLGMANMAALTASSAGSSMADARNYAEETGQEVSEGDVVRAGGISAAIEAGTEMIPYGRYFSGVQNYTKKRLGKFIGESVVDNPQAQKEIGTLLERAQKELGGKLFSGKGVKEYLKDVGYEGFSEFLAEGGGALVPMIYQNPEDYPTLSEVLENGWEGAKGGLFMGAFLGAGSRTVGHYANKRRREKQGKVVLAETEDGVVEIVGENEQGNGYSAMDSGGELVVVPKDVVKDMTTVGYDEFYNHVSEKVNDDVEESREQGYSLAAPQEQNDAKNLLDLSASDVKASLGYSNDEELESFVGSQPSASALLVKMSESGYDQKSIDAVADYVNAKARYEGLIQQVRDGIDGKIDESNRFMDMITHEDNMLHPATMKLDDRPVYVKAGNVVMTEDGSGIDHQKSDGSIVVCDVVTGELKMVDPSQVLSLQAVTDAAVEKQAAADRIRQKEARQAAECIEGVVPMRQGDSYAVVDESGNQTQIQIVQNNEDGTVVVTADGSTTTTYPTEQLQQMVDAANKMRLQEERGRKNVTAASQETSASAEVVGNSGASEAVLEQKTDETSEQKLQKVVETLPKKKDGSIDYKVLTPEQRYEYTSLVESPEVAIEDLAGDVAVKDEELKKLNDKLGKATGGEKTELRDLIRSKRKELEELNAFYQGVAPKQEEVEGGIINEEGSPVPEDVRTDEDYINWVADNSDDSWEILGAYSAAKELASHEQTLKPWQRELLGRKINTSSFTRFGDRNHITGALAKGWLRKDGYEIDTLAQELSTLGGEVTEQDIIDFMLDNPSNHVSQVSESMRALSSKFSEIATKEMGIPVSGPESNTGKLYIQLKEANQKLNELSEQQKTEIQGALSADMETSDEERAAIYNDRLDDYVALYDQFRSELDEEAADEAIVQEIEAAEPSLYYGGFTTDELDDIYSQIENNNGTEGQTEDSGENQSSLFGEEIDGNEEFGVQEVVGTENREIEGENSEVKSFGEVGHETVSEELPVSERFPASEMTPEEMSDEGSMSVVEKQNVSEKASVRFVPPLLMPNESLLDYSDRIVEAKRVFDAGREVNDHPSDAQKKAGNYKKGHVKVDGYDVTIENPKGSVRSGVDANGAPWEVTMNNTYGYIRGTEGVDGDHIDVFLSDDPANVNGRVYVVDQVDETGAFDEHKVMYGFGSEEDARAAYLANYSPGWKGLGTITGVSKDVFDGWLRSSHRKTKAFSEYKMVKELAGEKEQNGGQEKLLSGNDNIAVENDNIIAENGNGIADNGNIVAENANIEMQNVDMTGNSQQDAVDVGHEVAQEQEITKEVEGTKKKRSSGKKSGESSLSLFDNDLLNQSDYGSERRSEEAYSRLGETQREEVEGVQGRGMDRSRPGYIRSDERGSGRLSDVPATEGRRDVEPSEKKNLRNNRNERGKDYAPSSPKARFDANIAAIRLMRELTEHAGTPTAAEMQVLRRYSGWGGLGTFFNNEHTVEGRMLRELLGEEEYEAAAMSINSAYYTLAAVTDALWDAAEKLGFKGGVILEGSAGIGNILGAMPEGISERSDIEAVEIDGVSGNILKLLYPDAKVYVQGFQDTNIKNGSVDLAITNVPFVTGLHVYDKVDKDLSRKFKNIHDFCIAKNIRKLREGGIGIFITSNGTLDKSRKLREWIIGQGKADVVGAFRLNNETFGGTNATSDIIVVQKRVGNQSSTHAIDVLNTSVVRTGEYETGETRWDKKLDRNVKVTKPVAMEYNSYFVLHPEKMAGEMAFAYEKGDTFRPGSVGLYPVKGQNQQKLLGRWIDGMSPIVGERSIEASEQMAQRMATTEKEGVLLLNEDGELCVSQRGEAVPVGTNKNKVKGYEKSECLGDYNAIKSALDEVLQYQVTNEDDSGLKPLLKKLNRAYDHFAGKYGSLNRNTSISFLKNDVDFPSISALEDYRETKGIGGEKSVSVTKTNVFNGRVIGYKAEPAPTNVKDGVIASVYKFGSIDLGYIADKLDQDPEQVKSEILNDRIGFVNPTTGGVEVRYEYLSGNVREKLELAKANNAEGEYAVNIEELERVVPMDIPAHLIEFSLGSSWIDPQLYQQFLSDEFGITDSRVEHVEGTWIMNLFAGKSAEKNRQAGVYSEMFGITIYGDELVSAALNNRAFAVKRIIKNSDGSTETLTDKDATQACTTRIAEIKDSFKEWTRGKMQQDEVLAEKMMRVYNDKFNAIVPKSIDDMFLPERFGGAAESVTLYPHQKKSIIRGTTEPLMLAHEVGTGKTFTLISTAMEMRRIGTAKKPMIVVQNATVGQFVSEAKKLYPNASILTLSERDRTPEGRRAFYGKIKYSDWDMIVVPQSTFEMIPDSPERQMTFIRERIDDKMHALEAMREAGAEEQVIKGMERELDDLEIEFATVASGESASKKDAKGKAKAADNASVKAREQLDRRTDDVQYFDEMGVDAILVDEAHEYKRLGFATMMTRGVKGIDPAGSKKAAGVYLKTRVVLEQNGWKNVVFATGTPISNTAAELWTFMKYLMPKEVMVANEIYYFDDFVRNFGNISQSLEFATNGKFKENTRFAAYINKPELVRLWASVSDTVLTKEVNYVNDKVPEMESGKAQDIYLPQSDGLIDIMRAVRKRLDEFERMSGKEKRANSSIPLTMYGIAKRAAIDTRLVDRDALDDPNSKTNRVVEETLRSLRETDSYKGTVAIFCDNQRRWDGKVVGFDLFEDMKRKLLEKGVPQEQIVIMKSGMSVAQKEKIFADVNAGNVRVIIGNTQTLGTGVNIQERLHTLVHMDAPDRPMDYTQRNGRILRQGNLHRPWNKAVRVLRFGVEDSLDVTSYQRLKTKAGFIDSIMDGKKALANNQENRTLEEEEEGLFDNPVAVLSGSQYALLKNQAEREYRKYANKKMQYEADQIYITNRLRRNEGKIKANLELIEERREQVERLERLFPDGVVHEVKIAGKMCRTDLDIDSALREFVNKPIGEKVEAARKNGNYRGEQVAVKLSLDGVAVDAHVRISRESVYDSKMKAFRMVMHKDVSYSCEELGLKDVPVSGGYVRNALDDLQENVISSRDARESIEALTGANAKMIEENGLMKERNGKPFGYEKELKAAWGKVGEYTALMRKEMEEKEAKYAERGSASEIELAETEEEELRFRDEEKEFNELFNEELIRYMDGKMQANEMFHLGNPEGAMQLFMPDIPIVMRQHTLRKGIEKKHHVNIENLINMPSYLSEPIFVFQRSDKALGVLTEIVDRNRKNVCVAIEMNKSIQDGKTVLEVNDIRSFHGRDIENLIKPINDNGTLRWVDKKKGIEWITSALHNFKQAQSNQHLSEEDFSSAAKIIESFENPIVSEGENDTDVREPGVFGYNLPFYAGRKQKDAVLEEESVAEEEEEEEEEEGLPLTQNNVAREIYRMSGEYLRPLYRDGKLGRVLVGEYAEINRDKAIQEYNHAKSLLVPYKRALQQMKNRATDAARTVLDDQIGSVDYALWYYKELSEGKDVWRTENSPRFRFANMGQLLQEGSEFFEKEHIAKVAEGLAKELGFPIRIVRDVNEITDNNPVLQKRMRRSSGWYNVGTGEVVVVLPNAISAADVRATILHEVVGHKGLRQLVGDELFDSFLEKVYRSASPVVREKIVALAAKRGWNFPLATEEYLAGLAERGFSDREEQGFWAKVRSAFMDMVHAAKIALGIRINDNDLRYMLWRSYQLQQDPGIMGEAEHVEMKRKMEVGPFDKGNMSEEVRFRDEEEVSNVAQRIYEEGTRSMLTGKFWKKEFWTKENREGLAHDMDEGWHDYMRSLKILQDAVVTERGVKIRDFENAYLLENHTSSVNKAEWDWMMDRLVEPLSECVERMIKSAGRNGRVLTRDDVEMYMNSVHGLERNEVFARRDAEAYYDGRKEELDELLKKGTIKQNRYDDGLSDARKEADKLYAEFRNKDYSGLTALFDEEMSGMSVQELEEQARDYIREFEANVGKGLCLEMWTRVKDLNHFSLEKSYRSGLISKEQFEQTWQMFKHYVPLRGFAEQTAGDVYDYVTHGDVPLEKVLKKASGRRSRASNLLATMMNMGHSAIVMGNKNLVKQRFLNLALNSESDLLSVSEQWYELSANGGYVPVMPELKEGMSTDEQRKVLELFEEDMSEKEKKGDVKRQRGKLNLNLRIEKWQVNEHAVRVKRNGRDYIVWINGNPKAALAVNGLLNVDADMRWYEELPNRLNRVIARNVTSWNPEFIISNLERDVIGANIVTAVKEGKKYNNHFRKNLRDNISVIAVKGLRQGKYNGIYRLYRKYDKGTLDVNVERERLFAEFIKNGGETGYSHVWSIEDYSKQLDRIIKQTGTKAGRARACMQSVAASVEFANRGVENACRFAAYMTSREMGKTVLESIADAKEVSVNFNRKGSGRMGNRLAKMFFMFLNPAVQGLMQWTELFKAYPKKMYSLLGGIMALGFAHTIAQALISGMGGDDDDEAGYFGLNEWKRRNNMCIGWNGEYATIALPPEVRAFFGVGEIVGTHFMNRGNHQNAVVAIVSQLSQLLPLDVVEAEGFIRNDKSVIDGIKKGMTPNSFRYFMEAYDWNEDFMGRKITNQESWNELSPEWKRCPKGTSSWLVSASRGLNNLGGGDDYTKSRIDSKYLNPAAVEHLITSFLGGFGTFGVKMWKTGQAIGGNEEMQDVRNYPIASRMMSSTNNEYSRQKRVNDAWRYYQMEFGILDKRIKGYEKELDNGIFRYAEDLEKLYDTMEFERWLMMDEYQKEVNKLARNVEDAEDAGDKVEAELLRKEVFELKKECVALMEKTEGD